MLKIPDEILQELANNLARLKPRDPQRRALVERTAFLFNCSIKTVRRQLARLRGPRRCTRSDQGHPHHVLEADLIRWVEIIAAVKIASRNRKGRHLSTNRAIELAEEGVYIDGRFEQIPKGMLLRSRCDRWMRQLGISVHNSLRQSPAVRFEAQQSNECWQFDISVSDLHYLAEQKALQEAGQSGYPHLALFSVVDDYSRVNYQEYHLVYGEEVEAGLLFLFRAMAPKDDPTFPFQGIPETIYMDNGPLAKSRVVRRVLEEKLGVTIKVHETPQQAGSRRTPARSKGKVERCFRTLKESFETLFHFHKPESVAEANGWLLKHLLHYNCQQHPTREGSRIEVWVAGCPAEGFRQMCSWETYVTFAREPEYRTVDDHARITLNHQVYKVMEEIGMRCERLEIRGLAGEVSSYLEWLIKQAGGKIEIFSPEAQEEVAQLCRTPLQVQRIGWEAIKQGYEEGEKQISRETIQNVIAPDFRDLRTELKRLGYTARDIAYDYGYQTTHVNRFLARSRMSSRRLPGYGYQTTHVNRFLDGKLPADDPAGKQLAVFLKSLGVGQ